MTMPQYNEESLDKMLKIEFIHIVLSHKEHNRSLQNRMSEVNNEVAEEMRKFNENVSKFQCVNTEIGWANAQYSRKEFVEVVGIPSQADGKHLEVKVLPIFQKVGWTSVPEFIDDCHRLGKNNDRVIVKFTRRKDSKQVTQGNKDFNYLTTDNLDLPQGTELFVNQSLCLYYRILWSETKHFFLSGGTVKTKIDENSKLLEITYLDDLTINFPGVDLLPPPKTS